MIKKIITIIIVFVVIMTIAICVAIQIGVTNPLQYNVKLAMKCLYNEEYEEAVLYFEKAIQIDNKIPDIYFAKANAEIILDKQEEAYQSIESAINMIKDENFNSNTLVIIDDMFSRSVYKNRDELMLYWYENNYDNINEAEICEWIKKQLGEKYSEQINEIENKSQNKKFNYALEQLLSEKGQIPSKTDKRKFIYNNDRKFNEPQIALQKYSIQNGILSYYKNDFDYDEQNELFTAEVENNNILFRIYELNNDKLKLIESIEIAPATSDLIGKTEWTKIFIKEKEQKNYAFFEQYSQSGLISDGFFFDIRGYMIDGDKMIEIMRESESGSSISELLGPINNKLENFGLKPVLKDYYGHETSIAESSDVKVLVSIEQRFNGKNQEVYENAFGEISKPEDITPMDISIEVNS